jgi:hypothetical protein
LFLSLVALSFVASQRHAGRRQGTTLVGTARSLAPFRNMFTLLAEKYWIRPGINITCTTVAEDPEGIGVFAPPEGLAEGSFVGVYVGRDASWRSIGPFSHPYRGSDDYVMESGCWRWTPKSREATKPNLGQFPMAAMQEPPVGRRANCTLKAFTNPKMVGLAGSQPVTLVAMYTTERIDGNEELFVHYGDAKKRSYEVGEPALHLALKDIAPEELPCHWTGDPTRISGAYRRA